MKKLLYIMLVGSMISMFMTGCTNSAKYYTDAQVDKYMTEFIPGCEYVSQKESKEEDTYKIYTYEDENGREFHVMTVVTYAEDLSGKDIKWMPHKRLRYSYEQDVFEDEQSDIEDYLDEEWPDYDIVNENYGICLYLYVDDTDAIDDDTARHLAKVYDHVHNDILDYTHYEDVEKKMSINNIGSVGIYVAAHDASGKKGKPGKCYITVKAMHSMDADEMYDKIMDKLG